MDQLLPGVEISGEEGLKSWEARDRVFEKDESSTLGQHNLDDSSTRTKITHVEAFGFGFIGSVLSVAYGSWGSQPAALLVMQFSFRAKEKSHRYQSVEISICFESRTSPSVGMPSASPIVQSWHPTSNRKTHPLTDPLRGNPSHVPSSATTSTLNPSQSIRPLSWPIQDFWIRGRTWSRKSRQDAHEVLWSVTETEGSVIGISEPIRLAVVVTYPGPFSAIVDVKATTGFGLKMRNLPWSRDDPLLFNGQTPKGKSPPASDFHAMNSEEILGYICDPDISSPDPSQAPSKSLDNQNKKLKQSTAAAKADSASRKVYRVRGLPVFWSRHFFIGVVSASIAVREDSVKVHSFAENPYRPERMAIVSLDSQDEVLIPNTKMEWLIQVKLPNQEATPKGLHDKPIQLLFDSHFYGFSELGLLSTHTSACIADIIAIPGLGGHAYGSFKERGGMHMWLEDSLPSDLQTPSQGVTNLGPARILIYGYDTHLANSQSFQTIEDLAGQLRMSLRAIRQGTSCMRPIIFIGHSLGGILIKQLLILLSKGDEIDRCHLKSTRGALFFGVPNCGMENTSLVTIMETQANRDFLDSLSISSPFVKQQAESFPTLFDFRDSIIFSFHETRVTPTATMVNGKLAMNGDPMILVDKDSATHSRPWEMDSRFIIAVDRSHSDLVKFERYSDDYERVLACIRFLLENSADIVSRRFNDYSSPLIGQGPVIHGLE